MRYLFIPLLVFCISGKLNAQQERNEFKNEFQLSLGHGWSYGFLFPQTPHNELPYFFPDQDSLNKFGVEQKGTYAAIPMSFGYTRWFSNYRPEVKRRFGVKAQIDFGNQIRRNEQWNLTTHETYSIVDGSTGEVQLIDSTKTHEYSASTTANLLMFTAGGRVLLPTQKRIAFVVGLEGSYGVGIQGESKYTYGRYTNSDKTEFVRRRRVRPAEEFLSDSREVNTESVFARIALPIEIRFLGKYREDWMSYSPMGIFDAQRYTFGFQAIPSWYFSSVAGVRSNGFAMGLAITTSYRF